MTQLLSMMTIVVNGRSQMINVQIKDNIMVELQSDVKVAIEIRDATDSMQTAAMCNKFIELATEITMGVLPDLKSLEDEKKDSLDRSERHNINPANRPSLMQEHYYKEDNEDV